MDMDLGPVFAGQQTMADVTRDVTYADLQAWTAAIYDALEAALAVAPEAAVTFTPHDPTATTGDEQGWPLAHVIAHATATQEEAAAHAVTLARSVPIESRSRYETPWETLQTVAQLQARLHESRRMCEGFFQAWPDAPNLELTTDPIPRIGPMNAIARYALGLFHSQIHIRQTQELLRQVQATNEPAGSQGA
jgi:hypothetical protein